MRTAKEHAPGCGQSTFFWLCCLAFCSRYAAYDSCQIMRLLQLSSHSASQTSHTLPHGTLLPRLPVHDIKRLNATVAECSWEFQHICLKQHMAYSQTPSCALINSSDLPATPHPGFAQLLPIVSHMDVIPAEPQPLCLT